MNVLPPVVDPRSEADMRAALRERALGYTPEWSPAAGAPNDALAMVFARFASILAAGLRQVPARSCLAFHDQLGGRLLPAEAARAPLVFELMENATFDPPLAANSRVAAVPAPEAPSPLLVGPGATSRPAEVIFETEKEIALVRARLAAVYSVDPGADAFADHTARLDRGFTLLGDLGPTEHALYAGHDRLFALAGNADIRLMVELAPARGQSQPLALDWDYLSQDGWLPLGLDENADGTDGFTHDGQIALRKTCGADAKRDTIAGRTSYWIRGRVRGPLLDEGSAGAAATPLVDGLRAQVSFTKSGLLADAAATDAFAVDVATNFFPFGQQPARYTTFAFASKEAFQRRGARVRIEFTLSEGGSPGAGTLLTWEYFDGLQWRSIAGFEFHDGTELFRHSGAVSFLCPPDWAETTLVGTKNYWLRVRIEAGGFGQPMRLRVEGSGASTTVTAQESTLHPPVVARVMLQYTYQTNAELLDHCLGLNEFVFTDHTRDCRWARRVFRPFRPLSERAPAVHFGFDRALPAGLVSLYAHVDAETADAAAERVRAAFVWEYRTDAGWSELAVLDGTAGFRRSGLIQFVGPKDLAGTPGLGGKLHRIRARLKQDTALAPAPLAGLWLNAVWATHRSFVPTEQLGTSDGQPDQVFHARSAPVLAGEILEVREWSGRGSDYETAIAGVPPADLRLERDAASGRVKEVWIRWHERPHLVAAPADTRVYTVERTTGAVRVGGDGHGRVPAAGNRLAITYATGGGPAGNVAAGTITEVRAAVPFLKRIFNPVPALGGAAGETLAAAGPRLGQRLRHGDRGFSAHDYEWLARDASPAVARAYCLPLTGPVGRVQRGWLTLIVVPHGAERWPTPSAELRRRVHDHLAARAPATVGGRIRVVAPAYVPIGVVARIVPQRADEAARVEARLLQELDRFLHPLAGGAGRGGWPFGQPLHASQLAAVIERTEGVDHAEDLQLRVGDEVFTGRIPVDAHALIAAGDHELNLSVGET